MNSNDIVQLGPLQMSTTAFVAAITLLSAIVGSFAAFATDYLKETRHRRYQKLDELNLETRKVLESTMQWMEPIEVAFIQAKHYIAMMDNHSIDPKGLNMNDWPNLYESISLAMIPRHQRLLLPAQTYPLVKKVARGMNDLKSNAALVLAEINSGADRKSCSDKIAKLNSQLEELEELRNKLAVLFYASYKQTYK